MALSKQMEMFEDGGLKDEGGMIDEVSGNDVPSGSTREEVRDDIPAQLSEGEFVFPADVVRYIGLEKLMTIRQEAKQGLKQMEAMGQMGNSEEATMPDDLPFDINDLDMEESVDNESEMGYNRGGVIEAQQGTFVQNPVPVQYTQYRNEGIDPNIQGMQQIQPNLAQGVYQPNLGRMYGGQGYQQQQPVSFKDLLGTSATGAPQTELVSYYNEKTGQTRMIPHLVNADGTRGEPVYPIPEGFDTKEPTKEEEKKQPDPVRVPSTMAQESDNGDDDSGVGDLGGARTTIGGVDYAIQYNFDGTVALASIDNYNKTGKANFGTVSPAVADMIKAQTMGQISELGKAFGLQGTAFAEIAKKIGIDTPRYDKVGNLISKGKAATDRLNKITRLADIFDLGKTSLDKDFADRSKVDEGSKSARDAGFTGTGVEGLSEKEMRDMQAQLEFGSSKKTEREASALARNAEKDRIAQEAKEKAEREAYLAELKAQKAKSLATKRQQENIAKEKAERDRREADRRAAEAAANTGNYDSNNDNYGGESSIGGDSGMDASSGVGGGGGWTATGGFINKKKMIMHKGPPKKNKRMKKGGLASKK